MFDFAQKHILEIQFAATFGGILLLLSIEPLFPRYKIARKRRGRVLNNLGLTLLNFYLYLAFGVFLLNSGLGEWLKPTQTLFEAINLPPLPGVLITLFSFELLAYWFHRAMHAVPLLWRIHAVHHTDTQLDVSTSHRHHPFEGMLYSLVSLPLLIWLGAPFLVAFIYTSIRLLVVLVSHSNLRLPEKMDRYLRTLVVTPDFHRIHHLSEKTFTDSNYGTISPWFDYLFRTSESIPYADLPQHKTGLNYLRKPIDSRFDHLLALPFTWKK